jgi:hypothetical protein
MKKIIAKLILILFIVIIYILFFWLPTILTRNWDYCIFMHLGCIIPFLLTFPVLKLFEVLEWL